jgi:hypothetical protein
MVSVNSMPSTGMLNVIGNFALWLTPDRGHVSTPARKALIEYAKGILNELHANIVRVESDFSATPFKAKIADAEC